MGKRHSGVRNDNSIFICSIDMIFHSRSCRKLSCAQFSALFPRQILHTYGRWCIRDLWSSVLSITRCYWSCHVYISIVICLLWLWVVCRICCWWLDGLWLILSDKRLASWAGTCLFKIFLLGATVVDKVNQVVCVQIVEQFVCHGILALFLLLVPATALLFLSGLLLTALVLIIFFGY